MSSCPHSQWLDLDTVDPNWSLVDPNRLATIRDGLPDPDGQTPILVFFLGKSRKASMLRKMFTQNNIGRKPPHGIANLYVDLNTEGSDRPLIIADSSLGAPTTYPSDLWKGCHAHRRLVVNNGECEARSRSTIICALFAHLLFPMIHVVCLFAADLGGNRDCCTYVTQLMNTRALDRSTNLTTVPELIIISEEPNSIDILIQLQCESAFDRVFGGLTIATINPSDTADVSSHRLRRVLQATIEVEYEERQQRSQLYSASSIARIFNRGLTSFAEQHWRPMQAFLSVDHPLTELLGFDVAHHVGEFLEQAQVQQMPVAVVANFIATALFSQSYPPNIHRFHPDAFYDSIFAQSIELAAKTTRTNASVARQIRLEFYALFPKLDGATSAVLIRQQYLRCSWTLFVGLNSVTTCWACLVRAPEYMLHQSHGLCERCVEQYGEPSGQAHRYRVTHCPICGQQARTSIYLKPWTVEPNVLAIDGGGVKGVVALALIKKLTLALGSPVCEYFDYAAGTSAGGLIILDHIVAGAAIDTSIDRFAQLASRIFPPRLYGAFDIFQMLMDYVRWWLSDNKYDSNVLESVARDVFGIGQRLFDFHTTRAQSIKIGIMATTTSASQLRIFCNYNGEARAKQHAGYAILRSIEADEEPYLWEVARCTAAAPSFFRPKKLKAFGWLQDGGMRANNPSAAARSELRCIWPHTPKPNVVVSVGTGYSEHSELEPERDRGILWDGFIPRTLRGFLASPSVDGESGWTDVLQNLTDAEKERHFRVSYRFADKPPALDDASTIPTLIDMVDSRPLECSVLVRTLWASRFFLELEAEPAYILGQYQCRAMILFRDGDVRRLLQIIGFHHPSLRIMLGSRVLSRLDAGDGVCGRCGHFQQSFTFSVRHLEDVMYLNLAYGTLHLGRLPGSGKSVNWFIRRQTLHGKLRRWFNEAHGCDRPPKRMISAGCDARLSKRRRL